MFPNLPKRIGMLPTAFQTVVNIASLHMFLMAFTGSGKDKVESIEPNALYAPATLAAD